MRGLLTLKNALARSVYLSLLFFILCCTLLNAAATPAYHHISAFPSRIVHTQVCDAQTFRDISSDEWACIKGKLQQEKFSVPSSDSGELSGKGVTADFSWNKAEQTLVITVKSKPFFYSCASVNKEIHNSVDACRNTENVRRVRQSGNIEVWRIDDPNVKQRETTYRQIRFRPGDVVTVRAGGCVQHGGPGQTWKLYVNPQTRSSSSYFYGLIKLPGMPSLIKIKDFISDNQGYKVPGSAGGDMFLHLGYEDHNYSDNGYWGRDPGFNNQCVDVENAWVEIEIARP